jgi:hypothetical protein
MILFYKNILSDADITISASAENSKFPLSNLLKPQLARFIRMSSGTQYIQISSDNTKTIDYVIVGAVDPYDLGGADFSTCTFQTSDDTFASIKYQQTITKQTNEAHLYAILNSPISAKSFRIVTSGEGNKSIGTIYIGMKTTCPGMDPSQTFEHKFTTKTAESMSGQSFGSLDFGYEYLSAKIPLPYFNATQRAIIAPFISEVKNVKQFFMKTWASISDTRMIHCKIDTDTVTISHSSSSKHPYKTDITFRETF